LQGRQHTWFVGGLMNFESVEATAAFALQSMSAWVEGFVAPTNGLTD
jgi:hypothetical protein